MLFKRKKKKGDAETPEEGEEGEAPATKEAPAEAEGGAEAEGAEGAEDAVAKKKKKKLIIIGAGALVFMLAAGGGASFMLMGGGHDDTENAQEAKLEGDGKPVYFDIPQILVNLNTGGKSASFIKATVTLELTNAQDVALVQANLPRVMDNYNTFLREMKAADLYGSAGVYRLREEMLVRANKLLAPVKVKDVLFREILVQ